jgi:hypothetical protein
VDSPIATALVVGRSRVRWLAGVWTGWWVNRSRCDWFDHALWDSLASDRVTRGAVHVFGDFGRGVCEITVALPAGLPRGLHVVDGPGGNVCLDDPILDRAVSVTCFKGFDNPWRWPLPYAAICRTDRR